MNKKKYIALAKKSADIQINELRKIKKIFNQCLSFLDTRVELDQNGFKFDIFEH